MIWKHTVRIVELVLEKSKRHFWKLYVEIEEKLIFHTLGTTYAKNLIHKKNLCATESERKVGVRDETAERSTGRSYMTS